jgi:hypothetical protein
MSVHPLPWLRPPFDIPNFLPHLFDVPYTLLQLLKLMLQLHVRCKGLRDATKEEPANVFELDVLVTVVSPKRGRIHQLER